jgi:hypothetical protein
LSAASFDSNETIFARRRSNPEIDRSVKGGTVSVSVEEERIQMRIIRNLAIAGAALALLLFVGYAFHGSTGGHKLASITTGWSWKGAEREFSRDVTPQERIRDTFAQFAPGKSGGAI